jgi:hypothetical protein
MKNGQKVDKMSQNGARMAVKTVKLALFTRAREEIQEINRTFVTPKIHQDAALVCPQNLL